MSAQRKRVPDAGDPPRALIAPAPRARTLPDGDKDSPATQAAAPPPASNAGVVIVLVPEGAGQPKAATPPRSPTAAQRGAVHVAPNLHALVTAAPLAAPQETQAAKERHDLNEVVHGVLIVGLVISLSLIHI